MSTGNDGRTTTHRLVADSADEYSVALPGIDLDVVRTGVGFGPNVAHATVADDVMLASGVTGFPVLGRTTVADDRVIVALLTSTPPGSRWCEIDMEPGTMLLYGPGAEHTAVSPAGLAYIALSVSLDRLAATADGAQLVVTMPHRGYVDIIQPTNQSVRLARLLGTAPDPFTEAVAAPLLAQGGEDTVLALANALSDHSLGRAAGHRAGAINSRRITADCIEYAEASHQLPSIAQLCGAVHVSERRLRNAFVDTFGMPPSTYFRHRALNKVRRQLSTEPGSAAVGVIALDAGFGNLGRFSSEYRRLFGELPSQTLRKA